MRTYRGRTIDRTPASGYWRCLGDSGWLLADTLEGLKSLIRHEDGTHIVGIPACQYYALCRNPADGTTPHPILGPVPTCARCAAKHDLTLED